MPPWLGPGLQVLGFLVSVTALALSWRAFRRSGRLTDLQTRLAMLELAEKKGVQALLARADVRAALFDVGMHSHRISLENVGGATASAVDIEFLDEKGKTLLPAGEREDKLPIPRLDSQRRVTLLVALASGRWPPFKIAVRWTDPDGTHQRVEDTLYLTE
jgi:hypothetical protein